jgi:hypothetical protein
MLGWVRYVFVSHWLQFSLLELAWLGGYVIHDHLASPLLVLFYAGHIFAAVSFIAVGMYYLHPGNKKVEMRLHAADPHDVTRGIHLIFFNILRLLPVTGVLVFLVPDSGLEWGKDGSFWLNHVYNDNFAHMVHGALFYTIIALGGFNFLYVLNKRRQQR